MNISTISTNASLEGLLLNNSNKTEKFIRAIFTNFPENKKKLSLSDFSNILITNPWILTIVTSAFRAYNWTTEPNMKFRSSKFLKIDHPLPRKKEKAKIFSHGK